MTYAAPKLMTAEEFLLWRYERPGTWELVDGVPQSKFEDGPEAMAGGKRAHARIAGNLIAALTPLLRTGPCYPLPSDMAVRTSDAQVRQPDVTVECTAGGNDDLEASAPTVLFEVLSPSTRRLDHLRKGDEYRRLPTLRHFVLLEQNRAEALVWTRDGDDWRLDKHEGLEGELPLPGIGVSLPMREVYWGVLSAGG